VVAFHVGLGAFGYSKVLRYVILVTSPSVLLCALVVDEAVRALRSGSRRFALAAATCLALVGVGLEVWAGVDASLSTERDAMFPVLGETR
jgi:hypothetical protein